MNWYRVRKNFSSLYHFWYTHAKKEGGLVPGLPPRLQDAVEKMLITRLLFRDGSVDSAGHTAQLVDGGLDLIDPVAHRLPLGVEGHLIVRHLRLDEAGFRALDDFVVALPEGGFQLELFFQQGLELFLRIHSCKD